jgi:hypothetical protein
VNPSSLDGNAIAGDFAGVFAFDITVAITTCATCHDTHHVGTLPTYVQAPGLVLRCASCHAVQLRIVRSPDRAWLDLRGIDLLEIPEPDRP